MTQIMDSKLKTALHILADQYDAQGGHFTTTEADLMFKECFCKFGESIPDAFKRHLSNNERPTPFDSFVGL